MDFARVFERVAGFLDQQGFRCAVAGALGLHAYGHSRATFDLDLVTPAAAQGGLVRFLERLGYHASVGYSNHRHLDAAWGKLDVIYVDEGTEERLFAGCTRRLQLGRREALVPSAEHLIAMKVHAIRNDPARLVQDLADVQYLLRLPETNRDEARGYFEKAGLLEWYEKLRATL